MVTTRLMVAKTRPVWLLNFDKPIKPWINTISIPSPLIYYCIINGSSKIISKLFRTCKYLCDKYAFLRIAPLLYFASDFHESFWKGSIKETDYNSKKVNVDSKSLYKYWLNGRLCIQTEERKNLAEILLPKIYRNQITILSLRNQIMTFNEFKVLTLSERLENLYVNDSIVKKEKMNDAENEGGLVPFKEILECLSNLKIIYVYKSFDFPPNTAEEIVKMLPFYQNLTSLSLYGVKKQFDFPTFSDFIKKNRHINVALKIMGPFLVRQIKQFQKIVDEFKKSRPSLKIKSEFQSKLSFELIVSN